MPKDAYNRTSIILPSYDGKCYSDYPAGDKPQGPLRNITALGFPSNGTAGSDIALDWTGANMPPRFAHTAIWRARYRAQTGYYSLLWHCRDDNTWGGGNDTAKYFYGTHPYPCDGRVEPDGNPTASTGGSGTVQYHEIADGNDKIATPGGQSKMLRTNGWLLQARTVTQVGSDYVHTFWPDLESFPEYSIVHTRPVSDYASPGSPTLKFRLGASPWTASGGTNTETPSADVQGLVVYDRSMTLSEVLARLDSFDNLTNETTDPDVWYSNVLMTPTDVSDKSGQGHNPVWANANRPTLVTVSSYSLSFARMTPETPLSAGGLWTNSVAGTGGFGVVTPNKDMRVRASVTGPVICCEQGATDGYDDSIAALPGFPGNQRVRAVMYKQPGYNPNAGSPPVNHEIQIHVGVQINNDGTKRSVELGFNEQGGYFLAGFNGGLTSWDSPANGGYMSSPWAGTGTTTPWPEDSDVIVIEHNRTAKTIKGWKNETLVVDLQWNTTAVVTAQAQAVLNDLGTGIALAALRRIGAAAQEGAFGWRSVEVSDTLLGAP